MHTVVPLHAVASWSRWLMLAVVLMAGCQPKTNGSAQNTSEDGDVAAAPADGAGKKKGIIPVKQNVKDIVGNWVIVVSSGRTDNYRWIVKLSRDEAGKTAGEILDSNGGENETEKAELVETEIQDDMVRLLFKNSRGNFDFKGKFHQGFIRGTIRSSPFEMFLTRLLPTDEKSLERFGATGLPPGSDKIEAMMKSKDFNPVELLGLLREYKTSPVTQDVYSMLMKEHIRARFDEARVKELITDFLSSAKIWGERWEARMQMAVAVALINGRQFSQLALPHLVAAEATLGEDLPAFQDSLNAYKDAANTGLRVQELTSTTSSEQVRKAAADDLVELLKKQQFNAEILWALAADAEKNGNTDAAINYLSDIVTIPMLEGTIMSIRAGSPPDTPTPSELLKKLWIKKHGNEDGYAEHLTDVYHHRIGTWLAEMQKNGPAVPAADAGNKAVLAELFTGMMCPPCVSADLGLEAISRTFPTSKVIVLRYHQHIPKPDGLVNQDSEERAAFYELSSTPAVVVDGISIDPRFYSGPIQNAIAAYGVFRKLVDPRLSEKVEISLQLSAVVTDGQLSINVEALGIPEEILPSCRLRMAIVENNVQTYGPLVSATNGIRDHEFVVREMPGGAKGILPSKKGELKYSETMPIADLQKHVVDFITRFEAGRRGEFPAELKPPIRGPLSLVAWVQNGTPDAATRSKLVLQAALVPITGETGFGDATAAATGTEPTKEATPAHTTSPADDQPVKSAEVESPKPAEAIPAPPALPE